MTQPSLSKESQPLGGRLRLIRRMASAGMLLLALIAGVLLALRVWRTEPPAALMPGQTLALILSAAALQSPGVQSMSGAYIPGEGLVLYSRLTVEDRMQIRSWATNQLFPYREQLADLPDDEMLTWVIDYGAGSVRQEVIRAPIRRAADASQHRYLGTAAVLLTPQAAAPAISPLAPTPAPTTAPIAPPVAAPMPAGGFPAPEQVTPIYFGEFTLDAADWRPLSGEWRVQEGVYRQDDAGGYDYMSLLGGEPRSHYSLEARLLIITGTMGGGFVYNAPDPAQRAGAQLVDVTDSGRFIRWGHYNERGDYVYDGGTALDAPLQPGRWYTLRLVTHAGVSAVLLDGRELATIANQSLGGYVGLSTSLAQVQFDDVRLTGLPANVTR